MENGLSKIFDLWGRNIDVSDQAIFILKESSIRDEEGKKIDIGDLITSTQRQPCRFFF